MGRNKQPAVYKQLTCLFGVCIGVLRAASCSMLCIICYIYPTLGFAALQPPHAQHQASVTSNTHVASAGHARKNHAVIEHDTEAASAAEDISTGTEVAHPSYVASAEFIPLQGLYYGLSTGYVSTQYTQLFGGDNTWSMGDGNAALGAYVGYQFTDHLALETGYHFIFAAKAERNAQHTNNTRITPQTAYGVLKMIVPAHQRFDVFAKVGLGYVHQTMERQAAGADGLLASQPRTRQHVGGAFGAGANFFINEKLYIDASYMYITGVHQDATIHSPLNPGIPNLNMFMLSIGYYMGR